MLGRWEKEASLFKRQWKRVAFLLIVQLFASTVAMNLAFFRYEGGEERLKDLGFEWIPQLPPRLAFLPDLVQLCMLLFFVHMLALGSVRAGSEKPYSVDALMRWSASFCIGHVARATTCVSTTLPGSADHCLGSEWKLRQPQTPFSLIPNKGWPYTNCGDLIFSGHMIMCISNAGSLLSYGREMYTLSSFGYRLLCCVVTASVILQSVLIIEDLACSKRRRHTEAEGSGAGSFPFFFPSGLSSPLFRGRPRRHLRDGTTLVGPGQGNAGVRS